MKSVSIAEQYWQLHVQDRTVWTQVSSSHPFFHVLRQSLIAFLNRNLTCVLMLRNGRAYYHDEYVLYPAVDQ